jgi:hypothetical protein
VINYYVYRIHVIGHQTLADGWYLASTFGLTPEAAKGFLNDRFSGHVTEYVEKQQGRLPSKRH